MPTTIQTPYGPQTCSCSEADVARNLCPHAWGGHLPEPGRRMAGVGQQLSHPEAAASRKRGNQIAADKRRGRKASEWQGRP